MDPFAAAAQRLAHEVLSYLQRCEERDPPGLALQAVLARADQAAQALQRGERSRAEAVEAMHAVADALAAAQPASFARSHLVRRARA